MSDFHNPSLINLQALFVDNNDSHAQHGVHVRVSHHPLLGLPVMPFVLQRADVDWKLFERLEFRTDAEFRNQDDVVLTPPFTIKDGDIITVTLPGGTGNVPIWAELNADPSSRPTDPPRDRPRPGFGDIGRLADRTAFEFSVREDLARGLDHILDRPVFQPGRFGGLLRADPAPSASTPASGIKVTAYIRSVGQGAARLGSRHDWPFAFSGTGLTKLVVQGNGTIAGIRWLNGLEHQKILKYETVDVLNLPHGGGTRYINVQDWQFLCDQRRDIQAPKRRPMQDTENAPSRMNAPGFSQAQESSRVETLFDSVNRPLDNLITDSMAQFQQVIRQEIVDENGDNISQDGTAEMIVRALGMVLQSQADPGVASFLGYKTLDTARIKTDNQRLSFYRVISFFRIPTADELPEDDALIPFLLAQAQQQSQVQSAVQMFDSFMNYTKQIFGEWGINVSSDIEDRNGFLLFSKAVGDHAAPLDVVTPPQLAAPQHLDWLPSPPDDPIRVVETGVNDLVAGGTLAAKRRQPVTGTTWINQNSALKGRQQDWHALILPAINMTSPYVPNQPPPESFISDSAVGPDAFRQYVTQMDRFGRFSEWAMTTAPKGPRPKPPRPNIMASYAQPDMASGSHQGRVTAVVPLPDDSALAPGSFPLSHVELTVTVNGAPFGGTITIPVANKVSIHPDAPVPAAQDRFGLRSIFNGPIIPATQSRDLEIVAVWVDQDGQNSVPSLPAKLRMVDPYPPAQTPIPDILVYAARPDKTAKAWVERSWPNGGTNVSYAVYYADENRLRDHLRNAGDASSTALLASLEAEADIAARATLLRAQQTRFPDHLFERLKDAVEVDITPGRTGFRHALSGSLRVLSAYKIVAESAETSARPDLATVDTVFYGVPNSDPPARPVITARQVDSAPDEPEFMVELTITIRPGVTNAATARIRRTRSGVIDPLRNPVIETVPFGPVNTATGLQTATLRDSGSALMAPSARLAPFVSYAWIAEAQGVPEPGSEASANGAVAGLWSRASAPAKVDIIPDDGPVAPTLERSTGTPAPTGISDLTLAFSYPVNLVPTAMGPWTIRAERALPGQGMTLIMEQAATTGTTFFVAGSPDNPGDIIPTGTRFRVRIIDPIGRESAVVDHVI